jgi:hypothetical protein
VQPLPGEAGALGAGSLQQKKCNAPHHLLASFRHYKAAVNHGTDARDFLAHLGTSTARVRSVHAPIECLGLVLAASRFDAPEWHVFILEVEAIPQRSDNFSWIVEVSSRE